jgi:hypothetical protein
MKTAMLSFCFVLGCSFLMAVDLINESFPNPPNIPAGWYATGPNTTVWSVRNTNFAGGSPGELRLYYSPSAIGIYRFISPAFDTRMVHDMNLTFRHALNDFGDTFELYTIGVQISTDLTNWTTLWSVTTTSSIEATTVSVPVSFELGRSETTRIAIYFEGNNYDINYWYLDDICLSYNDTLGDGIWPAGIHTPVGSVIVPDGYTLQLSAGAELHFSQDKKLSVQGRLLVNGTEQQPVLLTKLDSEPGWSGLELTNISASNDSSLICHATVQNSLEGGIKVQNCTKLRISHCIVQNNLGQNGAGMSISGSVFILEHSAIRGNESSSGPSGFKCSGGVPTVRFCSFTSNIVPATGEAAVEFNNNSINGVHDCSIGDNYHSSTYTDISYGLALHESNGTLQRMLIACNTGPGVVVDYNTYISLYHCVIAYNGTVSGDQITQFGFLGIISSIIWGAGSVSIYNGADPALLHIIYSCVHNGLGGVGGFGMLEQSYVSNLSGDPLFTPSITGSWGSIAVTDWRLQYNSPCIDTAHPDDPLDPDGSRADMGIYYRLLKPFITLATDFQPDQGHQLDLNWNPSDLDGSYDPNACYSIWRQGDPSRAQDAVWLEDPRQLRDALALANEGICWNHWGRNWYFLVQVPALSFESYGMLVPTPVDSSATGLHSYDYMVVYANDDGYWCSIPANGYSVDNIPPAAASGLLLQNVAPDQFLLSWDPVTEGIWEGNSYPELNPITYRVYAGDSPDFPPDSGHFLDSTLDPQLLLNAQSGDRRFYRIIASDAD